MMHDSRASGKTHVPPFHLDASIRSASLGRVGPSTSAMPRTYERRSSLLQRHEFVSSLFWKALVGLLAFDLLGLGRNFVRMHRLVTSWTLTQRSISTETVDQVAQAIDYACVCYPKRVLCVQRSAVTTCLLRNRGVAAKMVIGAQILPFRAHAWTEVDGHAINERRDVQRIYDVLESC